MGQAATEDAFGSNAIRLTGKQWLVAAAVVVAVCVATPPAWRGVEPFEPGPDYRVPYALSNDYGHYARVCEHAVNREETVLVIGDSVIWGEYVSPDETLSHQLNELDGSDRFVNLGVNGIHPAALAGLVRYYGRAIHEQRVLLHYNPLWMTSPRRDLRSEKESRFNHPKLVPQFFPRVPSYNASLAERIGVVAGRYLPFRSWADHLAVAYFDTMDVPTWSLDNPYGNPIAQVTLDLPTPAIEPRHDDAPWTERGIPPTTFDWVAPEDSLQWRLFQDTLHTLESRGNRVFVIVGPFNEHMLTPENRETYTALRTAIQTWLTGHNILHALPPTLPTHLYADASHPLAEGYAEIAAGLLRLEGFGGFAEQETGEAAFASSRGSTERGLSELHYAARH